MCSKHLRHSNGHCTYQHIVVVNWTDISNVKQDTYITVATMYDIIQKAMDKHAQS